jgi:flavin-dependent thymidylate synthase
LTTRTCSCRLAIEDIRQKIICILDNLLSSESEKGAFLETTERNPRRASELFEELGGTVVDGFPAIHSSVHHTRAGTPYLKSPGVLTLAQPRTNVAGLAGFLEGFDPKLGFIEYLADPTRLPGSSQLCKTAGQTCFDEETEVLTDEGWKPFADLSREELVLTMNPRSGRAEFQKPLAYQRFDYDGFMFGFESSSLSFLITPDHRQWARTHGSTGYRFHKTWEIANRTFLVKTASEGWQGTIPSSIEVSGFDIAQRLSNHTGEDYGTRASSVPPIKFDKQEEIRALALLCVYYATEGSLQKGEGEGVVIYGDHAEQVEKIAETLGLKTHTYVDKRNGCPRIMVHGGKRISRFFEAECGKGAQNKKLPEWVLNLPSDWLQEIWDVLVKTDGYVQKRSGTEYLITTSKTLAGQAQEILCKIGYGSRVRENKKVERRLQTYSLCRKTRDQTYVNRGSRLEGRHYRGDVYCVTTENGIVFVRRNGKPHFSGNCYMSFGPRRTKNENAAAYFERLTSAGHGCYDGETEVLTAAGWKRWPEVSEEDELATLNSQHKVEYHRPLRLIRYRHKGRMYRVESSGVDLLVTPDHRMYACPTTTRTGRKRTGYRLIPCEELDGKSHAYLKSGDWYDVEGGDLGVYALLGFAIGDGYTVEGSSRLRFRLRRNRKVRWLRRVCEELGWELRQNSDRYTTLVPPEWREFFGRMYADRGEKVVLQKLLTTLPRSALKSLLDGLMEADGHRTRTGDCYDTTSPTLAGQVQQLCLHLGLAANISQAKCYEKRDLSLGSKPIYRVHIVRRNLKPEVNKFAGSAGRTRWIEDWEGEVYCAEVPNNTLYVRRNGKPVWSGNSVLEHSSFSFLLYGISRSVTHELVRHRAGVGVSQVSQRYVSGAVLRFVERPEYQGDEELHRLFEERADRAAAEYGAMADRLLERQESGNSMLFADYKTDARKKVQQTARSLLPNETEAPMVFTGNVRALRHIIEMRADAHAESEIRNLAVRIFLCLVTTDPILFGDYSIGELPDGTFTVTTEYRKA